MLSVRLDEATETLLDNLARETRRSKSFYVKEALKSYLEDMQDFHEAQKRSKADDRSLISVEELEKSLGL